jgi:hypothetical protein
MAIFDYLSIIDTYGISINLYAKSKRNYNNCLTFILSLITYIIFFVIFYFEQVDFFYGRNPSISYIMDNNQNYKHSLKLERYFLPLIFKGAIYNDKYDTKLFEYVKIRSYFNLKTYKQGKQTTYKYPITIEECSLDHHQFFTNLTADPDVLPPFKYYCAKGINYDEIRKLKYDKFDFTFNIIFSQCESGDDDCTYSKEFNDLIEENLDINMIYLSADVNLNNNTHPFTYTPVHIIPGKLDQIYEATVNPVEVIDSGDLFTKTKIHTKLAMNEVRLNKNKNVCLFEFTVKSKYMVDIYRRKYKSFSSGLANTLAIMRAVVWLFSFISSFHCRNKLINMFINDNYNCQGSFSQPIAKINDISINPLASETRDALKTKMINSNPLGDSRDKRFNFNLFQDIRYSIKKCFKLKSSQKEQFFGIAYKNITKTLSIENILKSSYEVTRLKYLLLSYEEYVRLKTIKISLDPSRNENQSFASDQLQLDDFRIIENEYNSSLNNY